MELTPVLCLLCISSLSVGVKVKIGLMLPKEDPYLKPKIGFGTSAGAVRIAINRIRKEHLLDSVEWR